MNEMLELLKSIQALRNPVLNIIFQLITMLGEEYFFILVLTISFWCINKKFAYKMGFAYLSSAIINMELKRIFRIPRPFELDEGIVPLRPETAGGYSFPSGHTQSGATFWVSTMFQIRKSWMYITGTILVFLIALSRLYLGVHTPIDVLGGALIGTGWVFIAHWVFDYHERTGKRLAFLIFVVPMVVGMVLFPTYDYYKVAGTVTGFLLGYFIESRYIQYDVKALPWQQILKIVIGMGILIGIKDLGKRLLSESLISDFIRFFFMGVWVAVGAPWLFKRLFIIKVKK